MFLKLLIAAGIAGALFLLCWLLRGVLLTPVKPGKNVSLKFLLVVSGPAPELEQTVDALLWLRANGTLPGEIIIADRSMDGETSEIIAALAKKGAVKIID